MVQREKKSGSHLQGQLVPSRRLSGLEVVEQERHPLVPQDQQVALSQPSGFQARGIPDNLEGAYFQAPRRRYEDIEAENHQVAALPGFEVGAQGQLETVALQGDGTDDLFPGSGK